VAGGLTGSPRTVKGTALPLSLFCRKNVLAQALFWLIVDARLQAQFVLDLSETDG
jgi:hypothetical protein